MNGNAYQWNDLDASANASRGVIGGFWFGGPNSASNTTVAGQAATYEGSDVGFRLAAPAGGIAAVPELDPQGLTGGLALGLGVLGLIERRRRT